MLNSWFYITIHKKTKKPGALVIAIGRRIADGIRLGVHSRTLREDAMQSRRVEEIVKCNV